MLTNDLEILQCPLTKERLMPASDSQLATANKFAGTIPFQFAEGLVNQSATLFYPVFNGIYCLHPSYAIALEDRASLPPALTFDRQRIFNYFNDIHYEAFDGQQIYGDDKDFVDFRPFLLEYTQHGFYNCRQYIPSKGKYYIDAASGPVAYKEYIALAEGYEYRVCLDLSLNALMQAKRNLSAHHQKAIFICCDLCAIPLKQDIGEAVVCQHALFHIKKELQGQALKELERITRPGGKTVIVYDWFYHSWFMNIALGPYQLYRIVRHVAGKWYARLFRKDKLYFYSHGWGWFKRNHSGKKISVYVWRSFNIHFSRFYLHPGLGGSRIIRTIWNWEKKYPRFMGRAGEYPIIVIDK